MFKTWICRDGMCEHEVTAKDKPAPIKWTDGHVCYFVEFKDDPLLKEVDPGDMDGDAASALASAGWGTDEDYGG